MNLVKGKWQPPDRTETEKQKKVRNVVKEGFVASGRKRGVMEKDKTHSSWLNNIVLG